MQGIRTNGRRVKFNIWHLILALFLILVDQLTKVIFRNLSLNHGWQSTCIIQDFFYFDYTFNTGAAFSFLSDAPWAQTFFKVLTIVALIGFYAYYVVLSNGKNYVGRIAMLLIICGAMGNLIDRFAYNGVVDFISFIFWGSPFAIFNLADSYLTIGVILIIIHLLFLDKNAVFKGEKVEKNN